MRCKIPSADLSLKLNDSICRYKGEPVYIRVDGSRLLLYTMTQTNSPFANIKGNDPDFDISSVPLGYVQYKGEVGYLTRIPVRKTKQGLDARSVRVRRIVDNAALSKVNSTNFIYSQGFIDMVGKKYPNLGDAVKELRGKYSKDEKCQAQIAISRDIAMWINEMGIINIHYKGDFVGWVEPDGNVVHVPSNDRGWVVSRYLSSEFSWKID